MLDSNLKSELRQFYEVETSLDVPPEKALQLGRALIEAGYKKTQGYVKVNGPNPTVKSALLEFSKNTQDKKTSSTEVIYRNGGVVGPYYSEFEDGVFCPDGGLAIWFPAKVDESCMLDFKL